MLKLLRRLARPPEVQFASSDEPLGGSESRARMLLTTRRFPIYYLPITKCGSTYMKNLFYHIDHGEEHPQSSEIHTQIHDLLRAGFVDGDHIRDSRFAFAVIRDPMDRMLSLYFDKIWGEGPQNFGRLRTALSRETGIKLDRNLSLEDHRRNTLILAEWLEANLAFKTTEPVNAHWRRQSTRLKRTRNMALDHLVLEGLDWQLPMFIGPAVPELDGHMSAVKSRNTTKRPVAKAELLTPDLQKIVDRAYGYDTELVSAARSRWHHRREKGWTNERALHPVAIDAPRLRLTTTQAGTLTFMAIPKAGCTFLRNLAYLIDHGRTYPDPLAIQADKCLAKCDLPVEDVVARRGFVVLRDPIARFISLYFDKVIGDGPHAFPWIAERLVERRDFHIAPDLTVEQHRQNCFKLLNFIESQFDAQGRDAVNVHWRPQTAFAEKVSPFRLRGLVLEEISDQLPRHLDGLVPDLTRLMSRIETRNASASPVTRQALINGRLESRILELYGPDRELHASVQDAWNRLGQAPEI